MKKTAFFILIFLIMISLSSCKPATKLLMRVTGNYKTPKSETPESIIEYAKKKNFHYDYLFMPISDSAIYEMAFQGNLSFGKVLPYNKQRFPIIVKDRNNFYCPHYNSKVFQSEDTTVATIVADTIDFFNRLHLMKLIDKRHELMELNKSTVNYDYYVIGTWSKMYPKMSKLIHIDFLDAMAIDTSKHICLISLNYDSTNDLYKTMMKKNKQSKKENKKAQKQKRKEM